jgi:hypothetical protein
VKNGGCVVVVAAVSTAIGFGYIYGAGFGWLLFAAFCFVAALDEYWRKRRNAKFCAALKGSSADRSAA